MAEVKLRTPISQGESKALRVGDIVSFSGEFLFCRDKAIYASWSSRASRGRSPFKWRGSPSTTQDRS
jgi:tartrate dehydratase beta subunit/fumarate hydratase class I family protein